ncbi:anaphase-promoting complex, subunit 10/DOC domain-containing protein [Kickxella alabastrina]|uniref:anaphase-promoting complex, subunit 10/DOC domain-containing protein n=1 Tax=Kickxella alabastrina TaxID=61397 RepID=UPI00221E3D8C|nr:anaphase-promoting complex, subunit 10/DOC domain-containing protein [Kickxella alabastrina]KAI7835170.1 anaphase-promoting complex, subunit 10/DOC domain-containing protein [Kickxella alabastrina]
MDKLRDISSQAHWTVSSSKHNHGVLNLQDPNPQTFWQSEGHQPHQILINFPTRQLIHTIALYLNIDTDESYTPCKILIYAGTSKYDKQLCINHVFTTEPRGWVLLKLMERAHLLCVEFPENYDGGRNVQVRIARVLAPPVEEERFRKESILPFSTQEFFMYDSLR